MNKRTKKLLAMMSAPPKLRRVSGTPPLTYKAKKAGTLTDYRIYGQTVDGESVGDRTGNLFDETIYDKNVADNTLTYIPIYVGNVNYVTCSTTCPKTITDDYDPFNSRYIFILSGNVNTGAQNDVNGVSNGASRTIQPSNGYVTICYRKVESYNVRPWEYQTMLNSGSSPLPYEPYGYKVPVTVEGKNLLQNTATSKTINGVTFTVNEDGSVTCNTDENGATANTRFYLVGNSGADFKKLNINANAIVTGSPPGGNTNTYSLFILRKNDDMAPGHYNTWAEIGNGFNLLYNETNKYVIFINIFTGTICDNLTFYPMIRKADIEDDTYEPYHTPVTTPIYLDAPLAKSGNNADYIDYAEQKRHNSDGTESSVTLPALPTVTGTNVLSVGTTVQPSLVEVTGRIRPVPTGGGE